MLKTYLYIPEQLEEKIIRTARAQKKTKAEVMRQALERGIDIANQQNGAQVLLELSKKAREILKGEKLPRDLSVNHDFYVWGSKKRDPKIKP